MADLGDKITGALSRFGSASLADAGRDLFDVLGYSSTRRFDLKPNSADEFRRTFDPEGKLDPQKSLLAEWATVDFLFQLSDDEIGNRLAFSSGRFENTIIESYVFLAIQLTGESYTRTRLAAAMREINRRFPMPVMVLFRYGDLLTLGVIDRELHKRAFDKDVLRKVTLIKDIRFAEPHRAHVEILNDLSLHALHEAHSFRNFVELHRAWAKKLDSSELNNKFFRKVTNWYFWAMKADGVVYPAGVQAQPKQEQARSIFFIRLLTRLMFCWFLQERGLIPRPLFRRKDVEGLIKDASPLSGDYYRVILQNLFFATLNREPEKRGFRDARTTGWYDGSIYRYKAQMSDVQALLKLLAEVPFVNGGLFDCLDGDYRKAEKRRDRRTDGFSDNPEESVTIPNELFFGEEIRVNLSNEYKDERRNAESVRGLIEILGQYKFTVEENTPLEQEIALDPELLGKVFENLLASYNEDTRTNARKQMGAFYTPRDIVHYMVDEALVARFKEVPEATMRALLSNDPGPQLREADAEALISAIDRIRVLDPACGSGAFPMGVLQRLVHLLGKLDPMNQRWKEKQLAAVLRYRKEVEGWGEMEARERALRDIEERIVDIKHSFDKSQHDLDFARKLYLIENSIYGVDIQPIACQIAKLRFFIALLVDQKTKKVRPLPNLETRLVAADSLAPIERVNLHQGVLGEDQVVALRDRLRQVRHNHFNARTPEDKLRYREEDERIREELAAELERLRMPITTARLLAGWNPYDQNQSAKFFDPEWMFSLEADALFDIVIGNPPYVRQERIREQKAELKKHFACYSGTADLYVYFYERGVGLLNNNGVFSFITSNKWFRSRYGGKLREWLGKNTTVLQLIDLGNADIFRAVAYSSIVILLKASPHSGSELRAMTWRAEWKIEDLARHLSADTFAMPQKDLAPEAWRIEGGVKLRLLERIKAAGVPLGEYVEGRFYYGIKTGLNEAFVVSREKRDELIAEHESSKEILKPFLRGRDVKRWGVEFQEQYLIFTRRGIDIKQYPAVQRHLRKLKPQLEPMPDDWDVKRDGAWHGRKAGGYKWYEVQDNIAYWEQFEQPKIIVPAITNAVNYAPDVLGYYSNDKTSIIVPASVPYLLAILNSQISWYLTQQTFASKQGGFFEFKPMYFSQLPIPSVGRVAHELIERVSDWLIFLNARASPVQPICVDFERLLNGMVYEIFFASELHAQKLTFFAHLEAANPPKLKSIPKAQRESALREFHAKISDIRHPVYSCLFELNGVEVVRIIESRDQEPQ